MALLLPLLLTFLPWGILQNEINGARTLREEDEQRQWLVRAKLIGRRFQETATPEFWAEEFSRQLKREIEPGAVEGDPVRLADAARRAIARRPAGMLQPRLWLGVFPDVAGGRPPILSQGPGMENQFRFFFQTLFRELGRNDLGLPSGLEPGVFQQRIRGFFGEGISGKLFVREYGGKAFSLVFDRAYYWGIWNILRKGETPVGAFFLLIPSGIDAHDRAQALTLRHWNRLFRKEGFLPAFLDFPLPGIRQSGQGMAHPNVKRFPEAQTLLDSIRRSMRIRRGTGAGQLGKVDLLGPELALGVSGKGWRALPVILGPTAGRIGVLLAKVPPRRDSVLERVSKSFFLLACLFWTVFFAWQATGGVLPAPGIRTTLLLWFIGLAATPFALMVGSAQRFNADLASNLSAALGRDIEQHLRKIDVGSVKLDQRFWSLCRSLSESPRLGAHLQRASNDERHGARLIDTLWNRLQKAGMEIQGVMIFGHGGFGLSRFSPAIGTEIASSTTWFHQSLSLELLGRLDPQLAKQSQGRQGKASFASAFSGLGILDKNEDLLRHPDSVARFNIGNRQTSRYFNLVSHGGRQSFVLIVIWNQGGSYPDYLRRSVARSRREHPELDLAVVSFLGERPRFIAKAGDPEGLGVIARERRGWGLPLEADHRRLVAWPCRRMPGYLLLAATSMDPLDRRLAAEELGVWLSIAGLVLLIVLTAQGLSFRLATPVIRMTCGLNEVASGDLEIRVAERRGDELGTAGKHLDTMTGWLRERSLMSRFVAPQVLEVVAQGNLDQACAGTSREVALLVSDVRSFTTMSESNPPETIFSLINTHIQVMTRVIQQHGGAIDRFIGDAIQAVFYPGPGTSMVDRALLASRDMMREHRRLNRERKVAGIFEYQIGIGVEIGRVVTGVLGDPDVRLDFTVLGEPMKHASDLEAASKAGKAWKVVCSPEVFHHASRDGADGFEFIPLSDPELGELWELAGEGSGFQRALESVTTTPIAKPGGSVETVVAPPAPKSSPAALPVFSQAHPQAAVAPPQVFSDASESAPFSPVLAAILWLMPVLLIWSAFSSLETGERERLRQEVRSTLADDLRLAESALDPQVQLALFLQNHFSSLNQRIAASPSPATLFAPALASDISRLSQHLPGIGWALFEFLPEYTAKGTLDAREMIRLTSTGGARCGTDQAFWWNSCAGAAFSLLNLDCVPLDTWMRKSAEGYYKFSSFKDAFRASYISLKPISLASETRIDESGGEIALSTQTRYLFWQPFFKKGVEEALALETTRPISRQDPWKVLREHLLGGVLLHVDQNHLDMKRARGLQVINSAYRGCRLAVLGGRLGTTVQALHPDFRRVHRLREILKGGESQGAWEALSTEASGEGARKLIAARPIPDSRRVFTVWRAGLRMGSLLWIGLGVAAFLRRRWSDEPMPLPLRWQLIGGFLLALVPTLLAGAFALERSFGEQRSRLVSHERVTIQQLLMAFDQSRTLFLSWGGKALEQVFSDPIVLRQVHAIRGRRERERNQLGDILLSRLYYRLSREGLRTSSPFIMDAGSLYLNRGESGDADLSPVMVRFFRNLGTVSLRPLQPRSTGADDPTKAAVEALYGAGRDEVSNLMYNFFPPEQMAGLLNDARSILGLLFFNTQGYLLRIHLPWKGIPLYTVSARLDGESLDSLLLPFWERRLRKAFPHSLRLRAADREQAGACLVPPYFHSQITGNGNIKLKEVISYLLPNEAADNRMALTAETGVFRMFGNGRAAVLHVAIPGKEMSTSALSTTLPIGLKQDAQAGEMNLRRGLLGLLLLLSLGLAWSVARRFLVPVMELSEAARHIMTGNFKVRLDETAGAEFGTLAHAFNRMAAGVEEGRLLSRFVSDSVRGAARDQDRQQAAQRGEFLDVIVLFAGLADFKSLLSTMPPDLLIGRLNRYLQTLSRAIRQEGGEIDKFIGDKILAVFHPTHLGGVAPAAAAAVRAADAMRLAMPSLAGVIDRPLGIGLVRGPVLAGIMGTAEVRLEYTVIGDTVNLASRLGDLALKLGAGGSVVIEASLQPLLREAGESALNARMERLRVPPIKGKTRSVEAFVLNSLAD